MNDEKKLDETLNEGVINDEDVEQVTGGGFHYNIRRRTLQLTTGNDNTIVKEYSMVDINDAVNECNKLRAQGLPEDQIIQELLNRNIISEM